MKSSLICPAGHPISPKDVHDVLNRSAGVFPIAPASVRCTDPTCPHESPVTTGMLEAALAATMRGGGGS